MRVASRIETGMRTEEKAHKLLDRELNRFLLNRVLLVRKE